MVAEASGESSADWAAFSSRVMRQTSSRSAGEAAAWILSRRERSSFSWRADCVLKNALSRGETFLDVRERGFPGQARKRGSVIEPYGKSLKHGGEPAGEVAGIALAVVELHGVHRGFHGRGGDPLFGEIGEGIENEGFGSADILSGYALEAS